MLFPGYRYITLQIGLGAHHFYTGSLGIIKVVLGARVLSTWYSGNGCSLRARMQLNWPDKGRGSRSSDKGRAGIPFIG